MTKEFEQLSVEHWRFTQLVEAGWGEVNARMLAASPVDLHQACDILKNGCSYEQALEILV